MEPVQDYTKCSWRDLMDVRERVNREKYPEAAEAIEAKIGGEARQVLQNLAAKRAGMTHVPLAVRGRPGQHTPHAAKRKAPGTG